MSQEPFRKEKLRIILDSNALFVPLQLKIDIFAELKKLLNKNYDLILLSSVKRELEILAEEGSPKTRKNARYALQLAEKYNLHKIDEKQNTPADDAIAKIAKQWNASVFTNDKQLRKRLRDISVPVIYVRQKSHLEIDGMI
jgi:rRNA-processing protein FCF1